MTNLEILQHLVGTNAETTMEALTAALVLEDLSAEAEYQKENKCKIYAIAIGIVQTGRSVKSESEGEYSKSYNAGSSDKVAKDLARQSGCQELIKQFNTKPQLRDKSNLW